MTIASDIAFPIIEQHGDGSWQTHGGMTKREYFAAMRKEPIFTNMDSFQLSWAELIMESKVPKEATIERIQWWVSACEKFAVMKADALIKALNEVKDDNNINDPRTV